jgi:hypothetical protein
MTVISGRKIGASVRVNLAGLAECLCLFLCFFRCRNHAQRAQAASCIDTAKGVIQGYTGVACADDKHQIIVSAEANLNALAAKSIDAFIPDNGYRQ